MKSLFVALALAGAATTVPAHAGVLFNQISDDYDDAHSYVWDAQQYSGNDAAYDIATIDDFTLAQNAHITSIEAAISGYNDGVKSFSSLSGITGYRVEIYSSVAAAVANLAGDVASFSFDAADVTTTTPFSMDWGPSALVSFSLDLSLAAGTYYLGVVPINDYDTNGQTGILVDPTLVGDALQVRPNLNQGPYTTGAQASYRIDGDLEGSVPEPASWAMMLVGFGAMGVTMRRRRAAVTFA